MPDHKTVQAIRPMPPAPFHQGMEKDTSAITQTPPHPSLYYRPCTAAAARCIRRHFVSAVVPARLAAGSQSPYSRGCRGCRLQVERLSSFRVVHSVLLVERHSTGPQSHLDFRPPFPSSVPIPVLNPYPKLTPAPVPRDGNPAHSYPHPRSCLRPPSPMLTS